MESSADSTLQLEEQKNEKPRKFFAVVNEASTYVRERLLHCFGERSNWTLQHNKSVKDPDVLFQWDDYDNIEWERVLKGELMANSYCVRKGLVRKAQLALYLEKYCRKNPLSPLVQSVPKSVILDVDPNELEWSLLDARDAIEEEEGLWILKPSLGDKGAEVTIVSTMRELRRVVKEAPDLREWVLQKYIEKPLLVSGRKFHLRAHVLAVGNLKVYLHEDVIALLAMEPYSISDVKNQMAHITNSCVQRSHPQFSEDFTVRLLSELIGDLGKDKVDLIFQKMIVNLAEIFKAVHKEFSGFFPLPNCFELYGVDFLIDENCNPIILEFNCGPDMKNTGNRLDHVISSLLEDTLNVAVDSYFTPEKKIDKGRLHLVYCDESNQWGSPNMSFN